MPVLVCVAHKLRRCLSYSRRRDRINSVLVRSLDKGGEGVPYYTNGPMRPLPRASSFPLTHHRIRGGENVLRIGCSHEGQGLHTGKDMRIPCGPYTRPPCSSLNPIPPAVMHVIRARSLITGGLFRLKKGLMRIAQAQLASRMLLSPAATAISVGHHRRVLLKSDLSSYTSGAEVCAANSGSDVTLESNTYANYDTSCNYSAATWNVAGICDSVPPHTLRPSSIILPSLFQRPATPRQPHSLSPFWRQYRPPRPVLEWEHWKVEGQAPPPPQGATNDSSA